MRPTMMSVSWFAFHSDSARSWLSSGDSVGGLDGLSGLRSSVLPPIPPLHPLGHRSMSYSICGLAGCGPRSCHCRSPSFTPFCYCQERGSIRANPSPSIPNCVQARSTVFLSSVIGELTFVLFVPTQSFRPDAYYRQHRTSSALCSLPPCLSRSVVLTQPRLNLTAGTSLRLLGNLSAH